MRLRLKTETRWSRGPMSLLVLDDRRDAEGRRWLRVRLPVRPNNAGGWIRADVARLSRNPWRLRISTSKRTVRVYRDGRLVRTLRAVVGASATPTPRGDFAIYERARQADPFGFVGPWALHLTAHSDVLDNYGGGPGRVAIHGRSGASLLDPLGSARSHGCVRIDNDEVRWLARNVPLATPRAHRLLSAALLRRGLRDPRLVLRARQRPQPRHPLGAEHGGIDAERREQRRREGRFVGQHVALLRPGPSTCSVRARSVTIRSACGRWTTSVLRNDESGDVDWRSWCAAKSSSDAGASDIQKPGTAPHWCWSNHQPSPSRSSSQLSGPAAYGPSRSGSGSSGPSPSPASARKLSPSAVRTTSAMWFTASPRRRAERSPTIAWRRSTSKPRPRSSVSSTVLISKQ